MIFLYRAVMDSSINPLKNLLPVQRFQVMTFLAVMWTTIFCAGAGAGAWLWYGELMVAHVLVTLGILITGLTFRRANMALSYRDYPAKDGTTRYDDVWGA